MPWYARELKPAMKRPPHILICLVLFTSPVLAGDRWVPYTDGRTGGCAVSNNGSLYGCTPQPAPPPEVVYVPQPAPPPQVVYVPQPSEPRVVERTVYVDRQAPPAPVAAIPTPPPVFSATGIDPAARDAADPGAALQRELCRADPASCK